VSGAPAGGGPGGPQHPSTHTPSVSGGTPTPRQRATAVRCTPATGVSVS
jgi:hypothetical protein